MNDRTLTLGDEVKLVIEAMSHTGDGIARHDGLAVFIADAIVGDEVFARVTERKKRFAKAELSEIVTPSPQRSEPQCKHFSDCGGCLWQHLAYEEQGRQKASLLHENLKRIGKLDPPPVEFALSPFQYGWRIKARFQISKKGELGFFMRRSHEVVAMEECPILHPELFKLLCRIKSASVGGLNQEGTMELGWSSLEAKGAASFRLRGKAPEGFAASLVENIETLKGCVVRDNSCETRFGESGLLLGGDGFEPAKHVIDTFWQANEAANTMAKRSIHEWVKEISETKKRGPLDIVELYAGSGNLTNVIVPFAKTLFASELSKRAVEIANAGNSEKRGHIERIAKNTLDTLTILQKAKKRPDLILLDPPREGAKKEMEALAKLGADWIVYLSCEAATFARDAGALAKLGYALRRVQGFDFFPNTPHIETLGLFEKDGE